MKPEPAGPFVLVLQNLENGTSLIERAGTAVDLELDPDYARPEGPVVVQAEVYRSGDKVEVRGEVTVVLELICDQCLAPVRREIRADLRVFAERRPSRDRRREQESREDDLGIVYHDGRFVDLTEEVRQLVLVEVPWHVVCRTDCRGLCPRCGADLNQGSCGCPPGTATGRGEEHEQASGDDSGGDRERN